ALPELQVEFDRSDLMVRKEIRECNDRGFAHVREGEREKAALDFAQLTELDPDEHWHWYRSAALALHVGNQEEYPIRKSIAASAAQCWRASARVRRGKCANGWLSPVRWRPMP